jgi:hypothetical protein
MEHSQDEGRGTGGCGPQGNRGQAADVSSASLSLSQLSSSRGDSSHRVIGKKITHEEFQEFENLFLRWMDRYQEELELGGSGNSRELATLVAGWAYKMARRNLLQRMDGTSQQLNFVEIMDALEIESQDFPEESDSDRFARLRAESSRRAKLLLDIRTYRAP